MKLQLNSLILPSQRQMFFYSVFHTKSCHRNEMGTPTHPPSCSGVQDSQHLSGSFLHATVWPAFVHPPSWALWSFPQGYKLITNLNYRAHFSSVWTDPRCFQHRRFLISVLGEPAYTTPATKLGEADCASKAWPHVGAPPSCMSWAEAWNVILQEEMQSFHWLTVISAILKALFPSLDQNEGGLGQTDPLSSESKTQKSSGERSSRKGTLKG